MVNVKIIAKNGNSYDVEMDASTREEVLNAITEYEWFCIDDDHLGQIAIKSDEISEVIVKRRF